MAAVPTTSQVIVYPRDKSHDPFPATIVGFTEITGLHPGGGPILPPDEVPPVEPPLGIWPGPGDPDYPIELPPDLPPENPPSTTDQVHLGWNWNDGKNPQYPNQGWYYVYKPGEGEAGPKK